MDATAIFLVMLINIGQPGGWSARVKQFPNVIECLERAAELNTETKLIATIRAGGNAISFGCEWRAKPEAE